ncbi:sigma-70 family RNA polymerase sigma factor [Streptomyces sp. NPDC048845]|uniref:RNA polymerase sigma factor n=1 Tax=Streptomyces sp. NPDC048845 TaxID=3155390 RepID=UPI003447AEE0
MPGEPYEEEFDAVYRRWYRPLLAKASMVCGALHTLAYDAVQEAFVQCWRRMNAPHAEPVRNWGPWLTRTVIREAVKVCNRHPATAPLDEAESSARGPDMAALMDVKEGFLQVCTAIARLPPRQRAVMVLHHLDGLSAADIADILGTEPSTVRVQLSTARRKLEPLSVKLRQLGLFDAAEGGDQR